MTGDSKNKDDTQEIFHKWVTSQSSLIVDTNASSRMNISRSLTRLGFDPEKVFQASSFIEAKDLVQSEKPIFIFTSYRLGDHFGLELMEFHKAHKNPYSFFILITSDSSQSAVARCAEEEIDAFILKPYTQKNFELSIKKAVLTKINPTPYKKLIQEGSGHIENEEFEKAMEKFDRAISLDDKPSMAHYFKGFVQSVSDNTEAAEKNYKDGLSYRKIHYRCLSGLFDVLMKKNDFNEAYKIIKMISRYFPSNPDRISSVLRLAVKTENFSDIPSYYEIFKDIEEHTDEVVVHVCAALIVTGKYFLKNPATERKGVDLILKASVTAAGKKAILKQAALALIDGGYLKEARTVLQKFDEGDKSEISFIEPDLLLRCAELDSPEDVCSEIQALFDGGTKTKLLYEALIRAFLKNKNEAKARDYLKEAEKSWPEIAFKFANELDAN